MSHELRTPLNSSLILSKLLAENKPGNLTDEQIKFAQTIYAAGNDLLNLVNDILDLSKIEAGEMDVRANIVSVSRLMESVSRTFQPVAAHRKLSFTLETDSQAPESFTSDPQRLAQILNNLVSNAFKFTEKGSVAVRVIAGSRQHDRVFRERYGHRNPAGAAPAHLRSLQTGGRQHPAKVRRHRVGPVDIPEAGEAAWG